MLLDGYHAREHLKTDLADRARRLGFTPNLAIVQVGNRPDSLLYIKKKREFAEQIGCQVRMVQLPDSVETKVAVEAITELNQDSAVHGIVVQLPLPDHLPIDLILEAIDPVKDADGLTSHSHYQLWLGQDKFIAPATAVGILELLNFYQIKVAGQHLAVVGRSVLVGKPTALLALRFGATATVCHSQTEDLARVTKVADILVVAAGQTGLMSAEYVSPGQCVVDVGINVTSDLGENRQVAGDVDRSAVEPIVEHISAVPGGVGPMTVYALFQNLITLVESSLE